MTEGALKEKAPNTGTTTPRPVFNYFEMYNPEFL